MTVRTKPWAIDGNTHPAQDARLALASLLGVNATSAFGGGVSTSDPGHGVAYATDLKVTQNGTPNMSVNVAAGTALVRGANQLQGVYAASNDATVNLTIAAADSTNPRWDLVILEVRDSNYSGASDDARLVVVQGTPAASPSDPSLVSYPTALVLARVTVDAGATSITTAKITDLRTAAGPWKNPRGRVGKVQHTSNSGAFTTVANISDDLSVATLQYRRYKITALAVFSQTANTAAAQNLIVAEGAGNTQKCFTSEYTTGSGEDETVTHVIPGFEFDGDGTTKTFRLRGGAGSSAIMAASATAPAWMLIEDIGGVVG